MNKHVQTLSCAAQGCSLHGMTQRRGEARRSLRLRPSPSSLPSFARRLPCSVQGYGPKAEDYPVYVYPGSGATCDTQELAAQRAAEQAAAAAAKAGRPAPAAPAHEAGGQPGEAMEVDGSGAAARQQGGATPAAAAGQQNGGEVAAANGSAQAGAAVAAAAGAQQGSGADDIEEDPDREFVYRGEWRMRSCP